MPLEWLGGDNAVEFFVRQHVFIVGVNFGDRIAGGYLLSGVFADFGQGHDFTTWQADIIAQVGGLPHGTHADETNFEGCRHKSDLMVEA